MQRSFDYIDHHTIIQSIHTKHILAVCFYFLIVLIHRIIIQTIHAFFARIPRGAWPLAALLPHRVSHNAANLAGIRVACLPIS